MSAGRPQKDDSQEEQRESIWSVSPGLLWLYLILFGILFVFGAAYLVYYEMTQPPTGGGHQVYRFRGHWLSRGQFFRHGTYRRGHGSSVLFEA